MTSAPQLSVPDVERPVRVELDIGGMTCAACAARIEKKLNKIDGATAIVNYATDRAVVTGLPESATPELIQAVKKAGYTAAPVPRGDDPYATSRPDRARMLLRRLLVAALLTLPLGNLAIVLALVPDLRFPYWQWVCVLLAIPVVFWCAWPFHRATLRNLRHGSFSMDTLVSLGVLAAFFWSVISISLGLDDQPGYWLFFGRTPAGADSIYLEVAAAVTTFLLAGRYFEARARRSAADVLTALNELAPKTVRVVIDGQEYVIPAEKLQPGQDFSVRPGETIAADGDIVDGKSAVDTSMMTGEPVPADLGPGARVLGGTIALNGRLLVRAVAVGGKTQLAQMAQLAEQAQARKAAVQRLVDRVVSVFVPVVLGIAVLTFIGWMIFDGNVRNGFSAAVSVLIIACPCAMGLATPTALMVGVGRAGQLGIVIKGPEALEASGSIDTVLLDKTGTLTSGEMIVESVTALGGSDPVEGQHTKQDIITLAAALESHSEHPIGRAIARAVDQPAEVSDFHALAGLGASATLDGRRLLIGNRNLFAEQGITISERAEESVDAAEAAGKTAVLLAVDSRIVGVLVLADQIKDSAAEGVAALRELGLTTVLLTGDNERAAVSVGESLEVDRVIAGVLPTGKSAVIEELQAQGKRVAMVGDGINDATALATANLGLAVLNGTDIALKSADMILVRKHLGVIADAIQLARRTLNTIRGNLVWAFAYNIAAIPLAATGLLNPLIAGAAMSLSSVFVVTNSLRLRSFRPRGAPAEDHD
ncbi:copper-translocating P-type ATPase [Microlunatus elymi]|uniref:Cation-transporting P-type ATPase B n=1 Tax=Microlunatus elymi TaxID=2596828 RepID=A0A516PV86_9ACTN|nr:heavy metal translocating P-type ATPase [Microlunatus elymi]QDP95069.1 copper-translocating P-type ATPase [Microlunatus elymi]